MVFKLLTYNIHKGIGGIDRKYSLDRIVQVLAHYSPDIALLQEVDDGVPRSDGDRQVDLLASRLGYADSAYQPNVILRKGQYGNAILSRFPITDAMDCDLTVGPKKRRRAQIARLRVPDASDGRDVMVVNVHLGLAGMERKIQLRRLFQEDPIHRMHAAMPLIVGGDFNDVWNSLGEAIMRPRRMHAAPGNAMTFPAAFPIRRLDAIYYRGSIRSDRSYAGDVDVARKASDHRPLIAEFAFTDAKLSRGTKGTVV